MERQANTITFAVDFNDLDKDGRLRASMRFASGTHRFPRPGEEVWTHDSEGNECSGTVYAVDGLSVKITLDRATWKSTNITNPFDTVVGTPQDQVTIADETQVFALR